MLCSSLAYSTYSHPNLLYLILPYYTLPYPTPPHSIPSHSTLPHPTPGAGGRMQKIQLSCSPSDRHYFRTMTREVRRKNEERDRWNQEEEEEEEEKGNEEKA